MPRREWVKIGNSVAGDDLLALTRSGEVWVYQGAPGPVTIGEVTTLQMYPEINGHRVAFADTKVRGVARIEPDGRGGSLIVHHDGSSAPYVRGR